MHALLFCQWKNRLKGRDWFDLEWYICRGTALHLSHFAQRAKDCGDLAANKITHAHLLDLLQKKIKAVSFPATKEDVLPFFQPPRVQDIWSSKYFLDLVQQPKTVG